MKGIEHVVLVMMENRSFDSMLGWLYEDKRPARNVPALKPGERDFEGLQGLDLKSYMNTDPKSGKTFGPIKGTRGLNVPNIAPGESYEEVSTQLLGSAPNAAAPTMRGYVEDYANLMRRHGIGEDDV